MTEEKKFEEEIDDNKNKNFIICQFCKSVMLKQHSASYTENQVNCITEIYIIYNYILLI